MADDRQEPRDAPDSGGNGPHRGPDAQRSRGADPSAGGDNEASPAARPAAPGTEKPPVWSGRAGVPRPDQRAARETGSDWPEDDEQVHDRWWMPVVIGLVALILFGVLAVGVWLIVGSNQDGGTPAPPPASASGTPAATVTPTTAAPTSGEPTPTGATARSVPVPPLVGLPQQTARGVLDQLGIGYRLRFRVSDQPVGTVLETDPRAGTPITPGEQVTLVIAQASNAPSSTTGPGTTGPGTFGPGTTGPGTFGPSAPASPVVTG